MWFKTCVGNSSALVPQVVTYYVPVVLSPAK